MYPGTYLISIQFLGFRYSGWQKQANAKTVQEMVDKTFRCLFGHKDFKTLAAGRTDAKVSANEFAFELFCKEEQNEAELLLALNESLPPDIKALKVQTVSKEFNVINDAKEKEYQYFFTNEEKLHPFCSPFMVSFGKNLNIDLMKEGAKVFEGNHNFKNFCYKPSIDTILEREILLSEISENEKYQANFFPNESWIYTVRAKGFLRHQVRIMMGSLALLGQAKITLEQLRLSLRGQENLHQTMPAPGSGLLLNQTSYFDQQ